MVHAMVNVISLSCIPCVLALLVLMCCMRFMILLYIPADMTVVMCTVVIFIKFFPDRVKTVQVVEDVERKVIFACDRMLIFVHIVGQERIRGHFLWCDGGIFVLKELSPCGIDGWAWLAKVEWEAGVHLAINTMACLVEEEKVIEFDCSVFVWKGGCGGYTR